jgi:hypothetical protein
MTPHGPTQKFMSIWRDGVRAATEDRDAPFAGYSAATIERRPDAGNVITPRPA